MEHNKIISRSYQNSDYEKIIKFLRSVLLTESKRTCWLPQKWEYAEYLVNPLNLDIGKQVESWHSKIQIWEQGGEIVAICHNESDTSAFFEIKKGYENLYPEMLDWTEQNIAKELNVFAMDSLPYQQEELLRRGYKIVEEPTYQNVQCTKDNDYMPVLLDGLEFVDANDVSDFSIRQMAVHRGFHPEDKEINPQYINSFKAMESAPMFRKGFEVMIKDSEICIAFTVAWIDQESNTALIEPMSVWPEYQGKGLGKQLVLEVLRRLKSAGINTVYVESYNDNRKAFYNKCGFSTYDKVLMYKKS